MLCTLAPVRRWHLLPRRLLPSPTALIAEWTFPTQVKQASTRWKHPMKQKRVLFFCSLIQRTNAHTIRRSRSKFRLTSAVEEIARSLRSWLRTRASRISLSIANGDVWKWLKTRMLAEMIWLTLHRLKKMSLSNRRSLWRSQKTSTSHWVWIQVKNSKLIRSPLIPNLQRRTDACQKLEPPHHATRKRLTMKTSGLQFQWAPKTLSFASLQS